MILETIQSPKDMKKLSREQIRQLANESRTVLLEKLSQHGGHNGPNLGVVEMTVALHYVFDTPVDKVIFDVSHQSYVHKMLTGRAQAFLDPAHYDDISGYTNPHESEYDLFTVGHTSTSISLANGVAKARDLKKEAYNVIAVIGDGSLSGGMAYEGLNNVIEQGSNTIVIVNDNDQSIAENHGGVYRNLRTLRETNGQAENNFFKSLGFKDYRYLDDGNDIDALIDLFEQVKNADHPVLLHIHTIKGKGFKFAEEHREAFHAGGPFSLETGEYLPYEEPEETYSSITSDFLLKKMQEDEKVVALNAGTPMILFTPEQRVQAGKQFIDVGIAEEHAVAMSAGIAENGAKPIWAVFSTFLQRTYDQISHDIALNNLPATILVYAASVYGLNDETHLGIFDIPFLSHIPNMVYLAPTNKEEYVAMLAWSIDQTEHPVAIRVPADEITSQGKPDTTNYNDLFKNQVVQQGSQVALIGVGNFYHLAAEVAQELKDKHGMTATLINPKFISGLDTTLLDDIAKSHHLVITIEDGIIEGGYGQMVAGYLGDTDVKVQNYGVGKEFFDRYNPQHLLEEYGVTKENIIKNILKEV